MAARFSFSSLASPLATSQQRRLLSGALTSLLVLSAVGCTVHVHGQGANDGGANARSQSNATTNVTVNVNSGANATGNVRAPASSRVNVKGSDSSRVRVKARASGKKRVIFATKPRVASVSRAKTDTAFVGADGSSKVNVSTDTPKKPGLTRPKKPGKKPEKDKPAEQKPVTPTEERPQPVETPIEPPTTPPENVFGYDKPVRGCFEGLVYFIPQHSKALPKSYADLTSSSAVYACEWDIPTRAWEQGFPGVEDRFEWFAIRYSGAFHVSQAGTWTFRISSDDGARLVIDDKLVIDNDGVHGPAVKTGTIDLAAGDHTMVLEYFQGPRYHINLQLFATPPGGKEGIFSVR